MQVEMTHLISGKSAAVRGLKRSVNVKTVKMRKDPYDTFIGEKDI